MNKKQKIFTIAGASFLSVTAIVGSAFALFSDREAQSTSGVAGTIDITASNLSLSNQGNINPGDNDLDMPKTYVPTVALKTTEHDLTFNIKNDGTKSIRTRHTLVVSVKNEDKSFLDARVFSLRDGETELTGKVYVDKDNKEYTDVTKIPEGTLIKAIKYRFTPDIFDGVGASAEVETDSTVKAVNGVSSKDYTYKLALDKDTPNEYQGSTLAIESTFEALQYRNTTQDDWSLVSTKTFTTSVANTGTASVPARTEN